jgi:hypothetical protein
VGPAGPARCESCGIAPTPSPEPSPAVGAPGAAALTADPARDGREARRSRLETLLTAAGALVGIGVLLGLLTDGTFDPGVSTTRDLQARYYDAQARSILHGRLNVPFSSLGGEAITYHGHTYGYFGIGPALLRLPIMAVYPHGYPNLAPWSYLAAFIVMALATLGIWRSVQRRFHVTAPPIVDGLLLLTVLAGSPTMFLIARPDVYEEAILWGVAACLVTFWAVLRLFETGRWRWVAIAVGAAAFAMASRPTVGGGALLAVGVSGVVVVLRDRTRWRLAAALAGGALLGAAAFNVNYLAHPERLAALKRGGANGIRYWPTNLVQSLRPDTVHFLGRFPWVTFRMPQYAAVLNIGHVHFDTFELPTSITAATPILTVLAIVGTVAVLRRPSLLLVPLGAGLAAVLATSSFFAEAPRYLADFVPWLVVAGCCGLAVFLRWTPRRGWVKPALAAVAVGGIVWSVYVSAALAHTLAHAYRTHNYFNAG